MPQPIANTPCLDCTFRSLIFDNLTDEELMLLNRSKVELRCKKSEKIITEGQEVKNFVYLKSGLVKLMKQTSGKKENIISLAKTRSFVGFLTIFSEKYYQYSIVALTDCTFCLIDINAIKSMIKSNGDFALDVLSKISSVSDNIICDRVNISSKQLRGRIAYLLTSMSKEVFHTTKFHLPITRREMGELIHVSTANVIRTLSEFRRDGLIETFDHRIQITDFNALEKIARIG